MMFSRNWREMEASTVSISAVFIQDQIGIVRDPAWDGEQIFKRERRRSLPPARVTASLTARVQYMRDSSFLDKNRPSAQRQAAPRGGGPVCGVLCIQVRSGWQRLAKANRIIAYFAPNYKKMPLHMHEKANRAAAAYRSVRQNAPVCGDNCYTPGNEFAALLQCALDGVFNAAAAGNLHARHGHSSGYRFHAGWQ